MKLKLHYFTLLITLDDYNYQKSRIKNKNIMIKLKLTFFALLNLLDDDNYKNN